MTDKNAAMQAVDELLAIYSQTNEAMYSDETVGAIRNPITGRISRSFDGSDEALNVHFSLEPVFSKAATYKAGTPTYVDMEFVTISAPGLEKETLIHTQVTEYYKWRFPYEYKAFKDGQAALVSGTPLSVWTYLSPSQAKGLEHAGIRTVEQLANLSDTAGQQFHGYYALKVKAQEFLEAAKSTTKASELQDELKKRDDQLQAMQAQMDELKTLLIAQADKKKPTKSTAE